MTDEVAAILSEMNRVHGRLDAISETLAHVRTDVAAIKARCPDCEETLKGHHTSLHGNGNPGIVLRVDRLERQTRALEAEAAQARQDKKSETGRRLDVVASIISGTVSGSIVAFIAWVLATR